MGDVRLSEEEIRELARKLHHGHLFTDRHLRSPNELTMVFMVVGFMDRDQIEKLFKDYGENLMIYEELDKAGPRSVNGLPMFMSAKFVHEDDARAALELAQRFREAEEATR